jgi:uncharacterized protein (TIRG00374 family)
MKPALRITAGLAISAVCLFLAFRSVPLHQLWAAAAGISGQTILACMVLASAALFLRSLRWRILLEAAEPVPLGTAFAVNSAGQMGNAILPARLGDLFRATNLGRAGLNSGFALATVLVERVLDTGFLMLISAVALGSFANLPAWPMHAARVLGMAAVGGLLVTVLLPHFETLVLKLVNRFSPANWSARLMHLARQFLLGLRSLHQGRRVSGFLLLTVIIWLLDCSGVVVLARGLSMPLSPATAVLVLTAIALSSVVPGAPGNLGVYQMAAVAVLTPFGVVRSRGLAFALILQILGAVTLILWGLGSAWYLSARSARPPERVLSAA